MSTTSAGDGQELEFKFGVAGPAALDLLIEHLGFDPDAIPTVLQVNHFFDTPDRALAARRTVLRLREHGDRYTLTLKGKERTATAGGPSTLRLEEECEVPAELARRVLAGGPPSELLTLAEVFSAAVPEGAQLCPLGCFENERRTLPTVEVEAGARRHPVVFELDATRFPGDRRDYEIEAEVHGECDLAALQEGLITLLRQVGIDWFRAPSKPSRFFALTR